MRGEQLQHDCPTCKKNSHEHSAAFCSRCGNALFKKLE
jgi:voltage-gated potassium channel